MAFDQVPWAISGSQLDAFVMRELANIATRDTEGIQLPGNCKVSATGTPSGQVSIAAGGLIVRNRQAAGQSYVGYAPSSTLVSIAPTAGAGRSDLVVATVRDPDFAPWSPYTDPTDILFGPYFYPEVISGVSSSTTTFAATGLTYSALALARIDIPAGTTNITNAMITDLRELAQPRASEAYDIQTVSSTQNILTSDTTYKDFPTNPLSVKVPKWATHAQVIITLNQVRCDNDADANFRVNFGGTTGPNVLFSFDKPAFVTSDYEGTLVQVYAEINVTSMQGTTVTVKPQGQRVAGPTGNMRMTAQDFVAFQINFSERVV